MNHTDPVPLPTEKEQLPWTQILLVAAIALTSFAIAIAWTTWLMGQDGLGVDQDRRVPPASKLGEKEIGLVDQELFELVRGPQEERDREREQLHSYGWVDKQAGVVRIPIDRAIQLLAEEEPR